MDHLCNQTFSVTRSDREKLAGHGGKVIGFTGLSGAGQPTIANAPEVALHREGKRTHILDGDNIRLGINRDIGFSDEGRVENIRRVAKLMLGAGVIVITACISPFRQDRQRVRDLIGAANFIEVFVDTLLAECEARDPKGLYKKARPPCHTAELT